MKAASPLLSYIQSLSNTLVLQHPSCHHKKQLRVDSHRKVAKFLRVDLPTPSVTHNAHTGQLMEFEVILLPPGVADAVSHRNTLREVQCFCLKIQQVALLHHNDNRHWPYI